MLSLEVHIRYCLYWPDVNFVAYIHQQSVVNSRN